MQEPLVVAIEIAHVGKYYPPHLGGIEVHLRDLVIRQAQCCNVKALVANDGIRTVHGRSDGAELIRMGCVGTLWSMPTCPALPRYVRRAQSDVIYAHILNDPGNRHGCVPQAERA